MYVDNGCWTGWVVIPFFYLVPILAHTCIKPPAHLPICPTRNPTKPLSQMGGDGLTFSGLGIFGPKPTDDPATITLLNKIYGL